MQSAVFFALGHRKRTLMRLLISPLKSIINTFLKGKLVPRIPPRIRYITEQGTPSLGVPCSVAQEEGFEPPWGFPQTVFKKLTAFPISSLTLPNRVGFYPKNRPFLHVFCIFARNLREKCKKTLPPISLIFFIFSSVSSSANFE